MNNFMTYEYGLIQPSYLTSKNILMVGRASDKYKRFELRLLAFEYISLYIPESKMTIISSINETSFLSELKYNLYSKQNVEFPGYISELKPYYKNSSLHIIPSICESFSMVLCETKIFGIPNILLGLEYLSAFSGGTVIIYDDSPESLAKESVKILNDYNYRKILGQQARLSMEKFNNTKLLKRWIILIFSVFKRNNNYYQKMLNEDKKLSKEEAINILKHEVNLIRKREKKFLNTFNPILTLYIKRK